MKDDKLMKDGDWMTKREALRENLPSRFTNEDLQARLEKVEHCLCNASVSPWRQNKLFITVLCEKFKREVFREFANKLNYIE